MPIGDTSPVLGLDLMSEGQGSADHIFNEAVYILEAMKRVQNTGQATPPGSPNEGDVYYVIATATGDWVSQEGKLTIYYNGAWKFFDPYEGMKMYVVNKDQDYVFDGDSPADFLPFSGQGTEHDLGNVSGGLTIDLANGSSFRGDWTGNITSWTIQKTGGTIKSGDKFSLILRNDGTGGYTNTTGSSVIKSDQATGVAENTDANALTRFFVQYYSDTASKWIIEAITTTANPA